jgi:hypothetical protein
MSSPFSAHEPWRRQQPDYAESASGKIDDSGNENNGSVDELGIIRNPACWRRSCGRMRGSFAVFKRA